MKYLISFQGKLKGRTTYGNVCVKCDESIKDMKDIRELEKGISEDKSLSEVIVIAFSKFEEK